MLLSLRPATIVNGSFRSALHTGQHRKTILPVIEMGEPRKPKIPVNNFAFFEDEFRERLQTLLEEIFSEEEPFTQTEDTKKCSYCDFKAICKR